jgi:hypothetical protein
MNQYVLSAVSLLTKSSIEEIPEDILTIKR